MNKSQYAYKEAKRYIPGGTQLLSKRPEMFLPGYWPTYYEKAKGCQVWDLDGRKYYDMSYMGIGASILGYNDSDVNSAVKRAINRCSMTTLNCYEEVLLAKVLCKIHPWAQKVRYARTGGESASIAVRIARAKTQKDKILFCGYHGWHDWYISANIKGKNSLNEHLLKGLSPNGVPKALEKTALPFKYNDYETLAMLIEKHKGEIAAIIMEPIRNKYPRNSFLNKIRSLATKHNIILIFDEVSSGWRLNAGGAHLKLGINPDMAIFAKAMSNGYPMAAIIGKDDIMDAAQETFISSTYWTERIGPTAALATINKLRRENVPKHLNRIGKQIQDGWSDLAKRNKLDIDVSGISPLGHFEFDSKDPLVLKTLYTQLMLSKGFLATNSFYASFAHKEKHIQRYLKAASKAFATIRKMIKTGNPRRYLKGPVCHAGFERLT